MRITSAVVDLEIDLVRDLLDAFPAVLGVGDGVRAAHERDAAMAKRMQMVERLFHRQVMVENDVGDVFGRAVSGDGDHRHRHLNLVGGRVEQQKAIHGALHQHARVLFNQFALPVVAGGEVEVVRCGQLLHHAAHDAGKVALAQVGRQHAYAHGLALPQRAGKVVGPVVEALGGLDDPVAGLLGNGLGGRGVVQDQRNGGLRELQVLGKHSSD